MAAPAAMLALKAAVAAATDKRGRTAIASVIAAVLTPFILIVVVLMSVLSGTTSHNNAAVELAFHGGYLSSQLPADYRLYIEKMRDSFTELDAALAEINAMSEDGEVDAYQVKAIFYSLFFGADQPRMNDGDYRAFADCFVTYEERDDGEDGTITVAVPIADLETVYANLAAELGQSITAEDKSNAQQIYIRAQYGFGGAFAGQTPPIFSGADGFVSPLGQNWAAMVTSEFGLRSDPFTGASAGHGGLDMGAATGTPIRAALPGVVSVAQYNAGGYGFYVMIDHGNGVSTLYGHCSQLIAYAGKTVSAGDVIALVGSTGRSTGPHLHFEVRLNGQRVNPRAYLP